MSSYCVFNLKKVLDRQKADTYHQQVLLSLDTYGGRYLVFGGKALTLHGKKATCMPVMLEFPDTRQAKAWFDSHPHTLRNEAYDYECYLFEGF
jgi:uncharacterized protein (DUF1330 family)